jgi:hypothetical protein
VNLGHQSARESIQSRFATMEKSAGSVIRRHSRFHQTGQPLLCFQAYRVSFRLDCKNFHQDSEKIPNDSGMKETI